MSSPPAGGEVDTVSVVVATRGRPDRLEAFVDAVLADAAALELLAVVDGPDPRSEALLGRLAKTRPRLRVLPGPHLGHLGALERGARAARGSVLLFLDDDVMPAPGLARGHLELHRSAPGLVAVGPMPVAAEPGSRLNEASRLYAADYRRHLDRIERGEVGVLDALWMGNVSMRRTDCLRVGLAASAVGDVYHEDRDLGFRLADRGLEGVYDPALRAFHLHRRTDAEFVRDARRQGQGLAALHRVHEARIGALSPAMLVGDLPRPVALAVALAGSTSWASHVARSLLVLGRAAERLCPRVDAKLASAKVARRVMQWNGAIAEGRRAAGQHPRRTA